ncbi:MAG: hypothetical protein ABI409_21475, partial [Ramlibacter sp.]
MFEQLIPVFKWTLGGCKGCRVVQGGVGACDEPADAVGNAGRTRIFILRGQLQLRQTGEIRF